MPRTPMTLIDKVWQSHLIDSDRGDLIYIDLHLLHEVTSPQAFEGLRLSGRRVRRPDLCLATADHDVPTVPAQLVPVDHLAEEQLQAQKDNCGDYGIELHPMGSDGQGILHVIGPEMGLTQPGMSIVCGDSHTATHGAFGAVAFGIGTSQVEHVLATQTLRIVRPKTMSVTLIGVPHRDASAKDLALAVIGSIGHDGGTGHLIEFRGDPVANLSMDGRMTLCNMAIEAGARSGLVGPDETTFAYLNGRARAPKGAAWETAVEHWRSLTTDEGAQFDSELVVDVTGVGPMVTWGTNPGQSVPVGSLIPLLESFETDDERNAAQSALDYMGLQEGMPTAEIPIHTVFIGSCTNGRLEDLQAAASVLQGRRVADNIRALVVPGSANTKRDAEALGIDEVFTQAGFEWRSPGCSMCIGMNGDVVPPEMHCASTSNRNFEGRQGPGARTHLVSPETAAATAIAGRLATPSELT
jgi:3-isopropylmalate/(R)-2-methylmalate dehydratase large subunit